MNDFFLLPHIAFGMAAVIVSVALVADGARSGSITGLSQWLGWLIFAFTWLTFISGGAWYILGYPPNKSAVLAGSAPWAHEVVMEVKEHAFFLMLMLATVLPFVLAEAKSTGGKLGRAVMITFGSTIACLGLLLEAMGAVVGLAVRSGLKL